MILLKVTIFNKSSQNLLSVSLEIVTSVDNDGKPESVLKLRNMYSSCMDTDSMESDGIPDNLLTGSSSDGDIGGWPAVIQDWTGDK